MGQRIEEMSKALKGALIVVAVLVAGGIGGYIATSGAGAHPVALVQRADDVVPTTTTVPVTTTTVATPTTTTPTTQPAAPPTTVASSPVVTTPATAPVSSPPPTDPPAPVTTTTVDPYAQYGDWGMLGSPYCPAGTYLVAYGNGILNSGLVTVVTAATQLQLDECVTMNQ
jgi:hypothetical protein